MYSNKTVLVLCLALLTVGCGDDGGDGIAELPDGEAVVAAVGSNFVDTSVLSRVVVPDPSATDMPDFFVDVGSIDGVASFDPVIRKRGAYLFVVNRFGFDNVTVLAASDYSLVGQVSTGAGSNPQDVALMGTTVYVATLGGKGLVVFDLEDMDAGVSEVDLSSLDSEDGVPNCIAVEIVDTDVWVACKQLDDGDANLAARGPGIIAVVDPSGNALSTSFELDHSGPTGFFLRAPSGGDVYIATVEDFFNPAGEGCLEILQPGSSPDNDGCLIENGTLGGYIADMDWTSDGILAAVVSGFDPGDFGAVGTAGLISTQGTPAYSTMTEAAVRAFDVAVCPGGERVISDAASIAGSNGLRIYDATGTQMTTASIDIGAPVISGGTICM